jgi:hypothetical protein
MLAAGKVEFLIREERHEMLERHSVSHHFRREAIHRKHPAQGKILLAGSRGPDSSLHHIAGLETVVAYLLLCHIYIVRAAEIIIVA